MQGGVGAGQAAPVYAVALGRDMFWESRKISTFVKRVPLPVRPSLSCSIATVG